MGLSDQQAVKVEMKKAKARLFGVHLGPVVAALTRLAIFDMLPALASLDKPDRLWLYDYIERMKREIGLKSYLRLCFAYKVVEDAEISYIDIEDEQINDGRVYLGCTRLDKDGVQAEIDIALREAAVAISNSAADTGEARDGSIVSVCCGIYQVAWYPILVEKRRKQGTRIANLAAAAHYMLARYHVCAGKAAQWQMDAIIDSYDAKKMATIGIGNKDLSWMSITPGDLPFPPDFAIRKWAYKGSQDGEADRRRCNADAPTPLVPHVGGSIQ